MTVLNMNSDYQKGFHDGLRIAKVREGWYEMLTDMQVTEELVNLIKAMSTDRQRTWLLRIKEEISGERNPFSEQQR